MLCGIVFPPLTSMHYCENNYVPVNNIILLFKKYIYFLLFLLIFPKLIRIPLYEAWPNLLASALFFLKFVMLVT
jgi:hypothetical protein